MIEIRQNKKNLRLGIIFLSIILLFLAYLMINLILNNFSRVAIGVVALFMCYLIYQIFVYTRRLNRKEPVMILNESEIMINKNGKPFTLLWSQITWWKVFREFEGTRKYLIIETAEGKKWINIAWLDASPAQIEALFERFTSV